MSDPNMHWDGSRWLRWDGTQWADAPGVAPGPMAPGQGPPPPPRPQKNRTLLIVGIVAGVLVLALIAAVTVIVVKNRSNDQAAPSPSPSPSPTSASPSPSADQTYTMFFVNVKPEGIVTAAGVKTKGTQVSGWTGTLRTDDLNCFNGQVSNGMLTGTIVTPPMEAGPPASQPFSWRVSGQGESFRLLEVGSVTPLREVPVVTVNDYAALPAGETWQKTFDTCAEFTGGLR